MNTTLAAAPAAKTATLPLLRALRRTGNHPLDAQSVRGHMEKERRRASSYDWWTNAMKWLTSVSDAVLVCLVFSAALGLIMLLVLGVTSAAATIPFWLWLAGLGMVLVPVTVMLASDTVCSYRVATWHVLPYPHARKRSPQWVREIASGIKRQCPTAKLVVHELRVDAFVVDPVLEATLGDESYFVTVWDARGRRVNLPLADVPSLG